MTVPPAQPEDWRGLAEARLEGEAPALSPGEAMRLVHELRVHQIELELQNEALREARTEAEAGWSTYRELYDFAPVGYFTLTRTGEMANLNFAGARLLGADRGLLLNRRFGQFVHPGDRDRFNQLLAQAFASLEPAACELRLFPEGSAGLRVRLELDALRAEGTLRVVAVDITELRAAEAEVRNLNRDLEARVARRTAELEAANQDLEAFCHMISHEMRAPLARMEGFSRMIAELLADGNPEPLPRVAQRIEASALRMRAVIDSLLKLTRLALEPVRPEWVDLSELAAAAVAALPGAGRPALRAIIAPDLKAMGDRRLLEIGLGNLLENAWKFTADTAEPQVLFGRSEQDGRSVYYVRDNGAGFDPAHSAKLFHAFSRLHRQEDFQGTGLGLCIVAKVIAKHGGRIWAQGQPGAGATFFFTLEPD